MVKRGEIYIVDLGAGGILGHEQGGRRPMLIVQNDVGNKHSPTVIVAALTSNLRKNKMPTHVRINSASSGLPRESIVLLEQLQTIDKCRLIRRIGSADTRTMRQVDEAIDVSLGVSMADR